MHTVDICTPDADQPTSLFGGGTRKRFFNAPEMKDLRDVNGNIIDVAHSRYDLHKYVTAAAVAQELASDARAIACDVPWVTLIDMLDKEELLELCGVHNIDAANLHYRDTYVERMREHSCVDTCERCYTILVPSVNLPRSVSKGLLDVVGQNFLKGCRAIPSSDLDDLLFEGDALDRNTSWKITAVSMAPFLEREPTEVCIRNWPLSHLVQFLSTACIRSLGAHHGLQIPAEWSKEDCQWFVGNHVCDGCPSLAFNLASAPKKKKNKTMKDEKQEDFVWEAYGYESTETYPPRPVTKREIAHMMRNFCSDLDPAVVEESACGVCAQIYPKRSLSPLTDVEEYLHLLVASEATRKQRFSIDEAIEGLNGPVLVNGKSGVCSTCKSTLARGVRPKFAMANSLWLGEVPDVLKDFTLAEQTLISRVRHSRCVVRVANGHAKMVANVISFEHPSLKIYNQLPVSKSDLDEVLAVVYTGVAAPTEDDLKRTPMLVRRQRVKDALEWLKLNHIGYRDMTVDYKTLGTYPLEGVPVEVLHHKRSPGEGNVEPATQSQFDNDDEQGTESGPCPFTVNGLTSAQYTKMTPSQRRAGALQHLKNGGSMLAVGHDSKPQSIYDNPSLYPAMFPWLFPYGLGGVGQEVHAGIISREKHVRWLLMYHDKRFQRDAAFIIVSFNHQLIREGTTGSFMLVKRNNFDKVAETIQRISPYILSNIAERLKEGGKFIPQTREEKDCFSLLDQIDYVGGQVSGSLASKKFQRNELWSLVAFKNAPHWFITLSPADNKHPLCIYLASDDEYFIPHIKEYAERQHLVTRNPVACARFFDYVIKLFIKHICGWNEEEITHGMFGKPSAFYGTVEQQGRMTLHLHHLLWIEGSLPPQAIRDRLLSGDSDFQRDLIAYLDSCRVGEFFTGTMDDVKQQVPVVPEKGNSKGIHTILTDENTAEIPPGYQDPTLTMPESPPGDCCNEDDCQEEECPGILSWWQTFRKVVDDIVFRSNIHKCFGRRDNADSRTKGSSKTSTSKTHKQHTTGKGCINKDGICTARFPRDLYKCTTVDEKTGHVNLKKNEEWINDITPLITFLFRCNTDTTCLLSGTAVKATLGYITDYITKGWLKTHQIFSIMYDTFTRHPHGATVDDTKPGAAARRMVLKIVNSLSAKMEIGAPMAALYLLGNPDHYSSHQFKIFYWKNYVNFVQDEWKRYLAVADPDEVPAGVADEPGPSNDVGITRTANNSTVASQMSKKEHEESVLVQKANNRYIGKATTDDYRHRPSQHEEICLYEWIQCSVKQYEVSTRAGKKALQFYPYRPEHPLHESHVVACDLERRHYIVPNFVGPAMPKRDSSEKEQYCLTMLCFFCPWRTGIDLKGVEDTWEDAFNRYDFSKRQRELMANFNLRYECYDARDDFPSMFKAGKSSAEDDGDDSDDEVIDADHYEDQMEGEDDVLDMVQGPKTTEMESVKDMTTRALREAGWKVSKHGRPVLEFNLPKVIIDRNFNSTAWRGIIRSEKNKIWQAKFRAAEVKERERTGQGVVRNDAFVVPGSYITHDFVPERREWSDVIRDITTEYSLNVDQKKAFNIVANHATCVGPNQLLMHLGGMGGTGKSQVIRALEAYFKARGEPYRLVLLGPTGTSAALIGGSTYHSFLGLRTGNASGESLSSLDEVLERLIRCGYIFLDETSMLSCRDLCRISARICEVLQMYEKPFGGLNVILAGDFAQLPPAKGSSLYSRTVSLRQTSRQSNAEQESTIGKMIWLQFTKVVILKENMRQTSHAPEEQAFRKALINLRYYNCDHADIALIKSRIANEVNSLSLDEDPFKNISIITARNRVKDQINECNVQRFSSETSQQVAEFYSVDKLSQAEPKRTTEKRVYAHVNHLSKGLKNILWQQPAHTSEQVPACLRVCLGMPIIIRYNEATELCITRGQEARVVGWTSTNVNPNDQRQVLDVLYVELVKPPKRVKLPNLPLNVVPLTKMSQSIEARLPSDEYICIARNQVPCLPNFAMTDYSSQGKTREVNVIDIADSRNFQSVYTCLSRGTTLAGTVIVRDFDNELLTGKLDGEIRQEYRELDLLDSITALQHEGMLSPDFGDGTRWGTIAAYRDWMQAKGEDVEWEPYLYVEPEDEGGKTKRKNKGQQVENEQLSLTDIKYEIHTLAAQHKRKTEPPVRVQKTKKRRVERRTVLSQQPMAAPVGPLWDSVDHSCAYDSCIFILYWLWFSNTNRWSRELTSYGPVASALVTAFQEADTSDIESAMNTIRNRWRADLRSLYPGEYPVGHEGADILALLRRFFSVRSRVRNLNLVCQRCNVRCTLRTAHRHTLSKYNACGVVPSIQAWVNEAIVPYGVCRDCGGDLQGDGIEEELLVFDLCGQRIRDPQIEPQITTVNGGAYRLVGVTYHGGYHFVSRLITLESRVFHHDGIYGSYSTAEGLLDDDDFSADRLSSCGGRQATFAVYARD